MIEFASACTCARMSTRDPLHHDPGCGYRSQLVIEKEAAVQQDLAHAIAREPVAPRDTEQEPA